MQPVKHSEQDQGFVRCVFTLVARRRIHNVARCKAPARICQCVRPLRYHDESPSRSSWLKLIVSRVRNVI
jgi:hypothetical protein